MVSRHVNFDKVSSDTVSQYAGDDDDLDTVWSCPCIVGKRVDIGHWTLIQNDILMLVTCDRGDGLVGA